MNREARKDAREVLIVGAGPTGLTLASVLRELDVPFAIVERRETRSADSKALGINILTQYLFELLGLGSVLGRAGQHPARMNVYWQGRRLNAIDFRRLDAPIRSLITQPQWVTERELEASLETRGVHVRRGEELLAIDDSGPDVVATLRTGHQTRDERYAFLVGCDGKASRVREHLGIGLNGVDYPTHFVLGDFELGSPRLKRGEVHYFVYDETFLIFVPLDELRWRVVVKRDGPCPVSTPPAALITEPVSRYLGDCTFHGPPSWISQAAFYLRVAESLGRGRVFLAGDAAHLFSPIGGTGMNTGIQDAFNLGWKLAYAWHGHSHGDALLHSYTEERLEAIQRAAAVTDVSTRLITREERGEAWVAPYLPSLHNRRALAHDLPMMHSGLAVAYGASRAVTGQIPGGGPAQPGRVLLSLPLLRRALTAAGRPVRPHDLLLLAVADPRNDGPALRDFTRVALTIEARYGTHCRVAVVVPEATSPNPLPEWSVIFEDALGGRLGLPPSSACLVRPDGVIGWGAALNQVEDARVFLESMLGHVTDTKAVA
ncbi:MAG: FAD-dependent monooxygenase [Polyangiaceae bacterium]